jgi:hypothetical protein
MGVTPKVDIVDYSVSSECGGGGGTGGKGGGRRGKGREMGERIEEKIRKKSWERERKVGPGQG